MHMLPFFRSATLLVSLTQAMVIIPHNIEPSNELEARSPFPRQNPDPGPRPIKPCTINGDTCKLSSECCSGLCQSYFDSSWCTTYPASTPIATNGPIAQRDALPVPVPAPQPLPNPDAARWDDRDRPKARSQKEEVKPASLLTRDAEPEAAPPPGGSCKPPNSACSTHSECCFGYCDRYFPGGRRCSKGQAPRSPAPPPEPEPVPVPDPIAVREKRDPKPFPPSCRLHGMVCQIAEQCCSSLCEGLQGHKKCVDSSLEKEKRNDGSPKGNWKPSARVEGGDLPRGGWRREKRSGDSPEGGWKRNTDLPHGTWKNSVNVKETPKETWKEKRDGATPHEGWKPNAIAKDIDAHDESWKRERRDDNAPHGTWKNSDRNSRGKGDLPRGSW